MIDFAATDTLDDGALRAMLAGAEPGQRVWAAWRIALRRGAAMPEIVAAVRGEPSPGVRRALLAILAGHGELDVLVALGRHDPADVVRAAAMALVTRIAGQGAIPIDVVTDAFAADPAIRVAVLGAIDGGAQEPMRALVARALVDAARPVEERLEAFEACFRFGAAIAALRWLAAATDALADDAWVRLDGLLRAGLALDEDAATRVARLRAHRISIHPRPLQVPIK